MRYPVAVPGMAGQSVEVVTSPWSGAPRVMVNGTPAQPGKQRGEFFVPLSNGQIAVIQFVPRPAFDNAMRITVNGIPQVLGSPLKPVEMVLAWMPILLMFIGGMIGGACAGLAVCLNLALFRSKAAGWLKCLGALATTACALILYLTVAGALKQHWRPTVALQPNPPSARVDQNVEPLGADDLALACKGATATSDSELAKERGCTPKVIDGILATPGDFSNRWHSSIETPHPHWVAVHLRRPEKVGRVVVYFADPRGYATSFQGTAAFKGRKKVLFDVAAYPGGQIYTAEIAPTLLDTFRLIIRKSANPAYPNAAQVSEIALYPPANP